MGYSGIGDFGSGITPHRADLGDDVPSTPLVYAPGYEQGSESSASEPAQTSVSPPDPSEQYSKYYSLADLTVTQLPYPNLPMDSQSQDNLRRLGKLLDAIRDDVGTFAIASCYRSPENQAALRSGSGGADAASMAVKNSYHSQGLAADITPTNGMTPSQFAAALYTSPNVNRQIGQITDKSEGGNETSLHISLQTPRFPKATLMYVGDDKQYYRMSVSEVQTFLKDFSAQVVEAASEAASEVIEAVSENPGKSSAGALAIAALAVGGYFLWQSKKD